MTVTELRQKYRVFTYQSAHWQIEGDKFQASFVFSAGENRFQHQVMIPLTSQIGNDNQKKEGNEVVIDKSDKRLIDQVIFSLGMVELLSYWKAFCSPIVEVQAGKLADWQKHWWHDLLLNGMGEYFFVNQIDFTRENFVKIVATNQNNHGADVVNQPSDNLAPDYVDPTQPKTIELDQQSSCLIPIGGGKDSIVTLEILKQFHQQSVGYSLANNNQRVVINQQIQSDQSPATSYQKPQSSHQQLAANNQPPTTNHQQQATSYQQPAANNQPPATSRQQPATSNRSPLPPPRQPHPSRP